MALIYNVNYSHRVPNSICDAGNCPHPARFRLWANDRRFHYKYCFDHFMAAAKGVHENESRHKLWL